MKKEWILAGIAALLLSAGTVEAEEMKTLHPAADAEYTIQVPGKEGKIIAADLMVPLRETAETLGFKVTWDQGKTTVENSTIHTTVALGEDKYIVTEGKDQKQSFSLGAAPYLKGNTTYVPLALFGHLLEEGDTLQLEGQDIRLREKEIAKGEETAPAAEIPNPWEDYADLASAEEAAGFPVTLPERSETVSYRAIKGEVVEAVYTDEGGTEILRIRKGNDTSDVSGDYTTYPTIKTIAVDGTNVRMKGRGNRMSLAVWTEGGHAYAISAAQPVTIAEMMALVRAVK